LSVLSRITDTHDYLMLIIPLIENPPWTRRLDKGKWQKLIDLKWTNVPPIDLLKVTKLEGQPWITLYHLIAKTIFRERYHLNTFRKGQLLRVRKYINEMMLDQLPFPGGYSTVYGRAHGHECSRAEFSRWWWE